MRDFKFSKLVLPEVVLLAILVIGLIISHWIVLGRSYIKLSEPQEVPASGFSFCMPTGAAWQVMPAMKYAKNSWFISGVQGGGARKSATRLTISYLLAQGQTDPNQWLISQAAQLGESIRDVKIINGKNIAVHAAMVDLRGQPLNIVYGIAVLPQGRSISLELVDTADDPQWGWNILTKVAQSFAFKGNPLLEQGQNVIESMRKSGIGKLIAQKQEEYFIISSDDRPQGFNVEMLAQISGKAMMNIRAINSHLILNAGGIESILQANDKFETFLWTSSMLSSSGVHREAVEVRLNVDATMSVRLQGQQEIETYVPGPAAIPEPFSNAVIRQMAAEKITEAMIDFIGPQGQIIPGIVQLQNAPEEPNGMPKQVNVRLVAEESTTQIYFDAQGLAQKYVVSGKTPYTLTKSSKEAVINEFPGWVEYISNLDKLLNENIKDDKNLRRIVRDAGKFI
jgi:hypothetical protein